MHLEFTLGGRVVSETEVIQKLYRKPQPKSTAKPKKTEDREAAIVSMGFVAVGYAPGTQQQIEEAYSEAVKAHSDGGKWPGEFSEFEGRWFQRNKPKRIGRPYELRESAQQCATLAERGGWSCVVVTEILKA